ncbi:hypothetical protein DFJ43DRAFT_363010 [Lentinula guzmanii]|uniref:Uncharacterized protein n=1 Tax=Lentinula guzmanii TaxID=2804957 RepID=A0AA38JJQ7_9AGAR|nr:hypothetical protein DFJ43DRAFT_363010 [Lentinula guzmanii]
MLLQNSDRSGQDRSMNSNDSRSIVSWPLEDDHISASGVRVTMNRMHDEDVPPLEPINPPRQSSGSSSLPFRSVSGNRGIEGHDAELDDSMPFLNAISESNTSDEDWSDDNSDEIEFETFPIPLVADPRASSTTDYDGFSVPFVRLSLDSSTFDESPGHSSPQSTPGHSSRFPRAILLSRRRESEFRQEMTFDGVASNFAEATSSIVGPPESNSIDDLPHLQSVSDSEDGAHGKQHEDDGKIIDGCYLDPTHHTAEGDTDEMPPLEQIGEAEGTASKAQNMDSDSMPKLEPITTSAMAFSASPCTSPTLPDNVDHDALPSTMPPFTTDGRGRVIAASNSDEGSNETREGRSFFSRMFDVLL